MTSVRTPQKYSQFSPHTTPSPSTNRSLEEVDLLSYQPPQPENQYQLSPTHHQTRQDEGISHLICSIFEQLFGSDHLQLKMQDSQVREIDLYGDLWSEISQQIERLHQIEQQLAQLLRVFENRNTKMTNQDKWKMVVLSYRDKTSKLQIKLQQQRKARAMLQQTVHLFEEQKERLNHLNTMKFKKINILMSQQQEYQLEIEQLNRTVSNLQLEVDESRCEHSRLESELEEVKKVKNQLTLQLDNVRQQSVLVEKENQSINRQLKVLGEEEETINKQIIDLKTKYQIEIVKLQNTVSNLTIQRQQNLMVIEELERMLEIEQRVIEKAEAQTQTEVQTLKAEYYNSLADELDGDSYYSGEEENDQDNFSQELGKGQAELLSEGEAEDDNEFQIPIGSMSASHHLVLTDRSIKEKLDNLSERGTPVVDASFDECVSNTPSKYLETMGELTSSLAEAYQKINELNEKVEQLEDAKAKVEKKLKEKQEKLTSTKDKQSIFSSFFKK